MQADIIPATTVVGIGDVTPISTILFVMKTYTLPEITPAIDSIPNPKNTPPIVAVNPKR